jgi:hypothetical protein
LRELILSGVADAVNVDDIAIDSKQDAINVRLATVKLLSEIDTHFDEIIRLWPTISFGRQTRDGRFDSGVPIRRGFG